MRKELKKVVNGTDYVFYQFGATEGLKTWIKITKIVGTSLGMVADKFVSNQDILKEDVSRFGIDKIVESLCSKLEADEVLELVLKILSQVTCNGKRVNEIFESHFAGGKYSEMFKVVYIALEVNYKDFLFETVAGLTQGKP